MDGQEVLHGKGGQGEGKVAFRSDIVGDESLLCPGQPSTGADETRMAARG
jgi:hypothetical protein